MSLTSLKYSSSGSLRASCSHFWLIVLAEASDAASELRNVCLLMIASLSLLSSGNQGKGNQRATRQLDINLIQIKVPSQSSQQPENLSELTGVNFAYIVILRCVDLRVLLLGPCANH